jgi:hypothetical protein
LSVDFADLVPYVTINEISTVVMVYAVSGFGMTAYNVSSPGTALAQTAIANAFSNVPRPVCDYAVTPPVWRGQTLQRIPEIKVKISLQFLFADPDFPFHGQSPEAERGVC